MTIKELKKGEFFKLTENGQVLVRGEYDRSLKRYSCYYFDDVNRERLFKQEQENGMEHNLLTKAKDLIITYLHNEFDEDADFSDTTDIGLAYTTDEYDREIQVSLNLDELTMIYYHEGYETRYEKYNTLEELIEYQLRFLNFDDLVADC